MNLKEFKKFVDSNLKNTNGIVTCIVIFALGYVIVKALLGVHIYSRRESFEGQKELLLLHMEGCPHCVKLMPHWTAASQDNNTRITMRAVERKEGDGPALCKKHNVTGFPTILLLEGGEKLKTYDGPRTTPGLLGFLNQNA